MESKEGVKEYVERQSQEFINQFLTGEELEALYYYQQAKSEQDAENAWLRHAEMGNVYDDPRGN